MKSRILEFIKNNPDTWEEKLNERYLYYEADKPLIPQVKENGKLAGEMLAMVEDMVSRVQCG